MSMPVEFLTYVWEGNERDQSWVRMLLDGFLYGASPCHEIRFAMVGFWPEALIEVVENRAHSMAALCWKADGQPWLRATTADLTGPTISHQNWGYVFALRLDCLESA